MAGHSKQTDVTTSERVIQKIAEEEGVSTTTLEPPLNDVIDPDALNQLFKATTTGAEPTSPKVIFPYHGYQIQVTEETVQLMETRQDDSTDKSCSSGDTA